MIKNVPDCLCQVGEGVWCIKTYRFIASPSRHADISHILEDSPKRVSSSHPRRLLVRAERRPGPSVGVRKIEDKNKLVVLALLLGRAACPFWS